LAIQPLLHHSPLLASELTLNLLLPSLPALQYIDCNELLKSHHLAFAEAFRESRQQWPQSNKAPWLRAWWKFLIEALDAFSALASQHAIGNRRGSRRALIEHYVDNESNGFSLQQICQTLPSVSRDMIRLVLAEMRQQGKLKCESRGRNALWIKTG
jgi:hypothetical protein